MPAISDQFRFIIWIITGSGYAIFAILGFVLEPNIAFKIRQIFGQRQGRPPTRRPLRYWMVFFLSLFIGILGTAIASSAPPLNTEPQPNIGEVASTSTPKPTIVQSLTPESILFPIPTINKVITGYELAGYSKQSSAAQDSTGKITVFIKNDDGQLAFIESIDNGLSWSSPSVFDTIQPPGGPQVSIATDSADRIHVVWGRAPESGNAEYGLIENGAFVQKSTVGTGVFARDIAIDSANHPHIVWTNIDLYHTTFNGQDWIGPEEIARGAWHPDIKITANDDLLVFVNSGGFYPAPEVSVYALDNISGLWNFTEVSQSPFWSGGAVAALSKEGNIYLFWVGSSNEGGGSDQVFFSRFIEGGWQTPFQIGEINASAGSTGQESPTVAFDSNDILYVFWRGLNDKGRPVIFARAFASETSPQNRVTPGWSPIIELDDRNTSNVVWPTIADINIRNRGNGVLVFWSAIEGTNKIINFSHVTYP